MRRRIRRFPLVPALCGLLLAPAAPVGATRPPPVPPLPPPLPLEALYGNAARTDPDGAGHALPAAGPVAACWTPGRELLVDGARFAARARAHGVRVVGATLLPCGGLPGVHGAAVETERTTVNAWIRRTPATSDARRSPRPWRAPCCEGYTSRSTTTGAWSEAPLPLRSSRST
ncbi:hypothetical protein [Streptomyces sp. Amel2xC10]|uniref:hypothetical protein n=1 Tax=Streptomyces sp. Amel2xC10 TaxID=1305826 RepID=UPI000A08983B|nr:hypothetical protein [Streptomyces sp. Amel2xC10]SMF40441.1 hypothetical protein SAMN02745830_03338 [Streptomyces sp. Amel2xC10]